MISPRPVGFGDAVLACVVFLGAQLVLGGMLGIAAIFGKLAMSPGILAVLDIAAFVAAMAFVLERHRTRLRRYVPIGRPGYRPFLSVVVGGLGLALVLIPVDTLLVRLMPIPDILGSAFGMVASPKDVLGSFILVSIVAPVLEEILCRGYAVEGLAEKYGNTRGLILSSLLFGLLHMNPYQFVSGLVVGLFLGAVFLRSGSILPCIVGHVVYNTIVLFGSDLPGVVAKEARTTLGITEAAAVSMEICVGVLIAGVACWLLSARPQSSAGPGQWDSGGR